MTAAASFLAAAGLLPDASGHFGRYGGRFVPEALIAALDELDAAYRHAQADEAFQAEFHRLLRDYAGTPSMLYDATRLSEKVGMRILLKREDLNHTGAHKVRSTGWPARPRVRCSTWSAWCTWARRTPAARRST